MTHFIWRWLCNAIAILLVAYLMPGVFLASGGAALTAALLLGVVNALIRPVCLLFSLPINIMTLGLFTFVINAGMLKIVDVLMSGFATGGFLNTLIAALFISIISSVFTSFMREERRMF